MGRRHVAIGLAVLGLLAWQVWAGGERADANEVVVAEQPREARAVPARLSPVIPTLEVGIDIEDLEVIRRFEGELVGHSDEGDGLTDAERQAGVVAELEDRLPPRRGAVHGEVRDLATDERLAGVTVVVTSPALEGAQAAITDEHGAYAITDLPPGSYLVTFYYLELTVERNGIAVVAQEAREVSQRLEMPSRQEEVSLSFHCGGGSTTNTYYVDGIDVTGLELGDDDTKIPGVTITDTIEREIHHEIDETDAFQEPTR